VENNEIEKNWKLILNKIDSNTQEMNSIFLDKQEEASERQEGMLNLVNIILGGGILFEILGFFIMDANSLNLVNRILGGILFLIVAVGLVRLKIPKRKKKKKEKETIKEE